MSTRLVFIVYVKEVGIHVRRTPYSTTSTLLDFARLKWVSIAYLENDMNVEVEVLMIWV